MQQFASNLEQNPVQLARWQSFCAWATPVHQWAMVFLNHWMTIPFTPFHSDIMQFVVDGLLGRIPNECVRSAIISPRSFGKSTCAKIAALYLMTEAVQSGMCVSRKGRDFDFFYVTSTLDLAKDAYAPLLYELAENKFLLGQYGQLLKSVEKGPPTNWVLHNGIKGSARSVGGKLRGHHPAWMLLDDIESGENISSDDTRAKFRHQWETEIDMMMVPHETYSTLIGNYMHLFCLYRHVALLDDTHTVIRSALEPVDSRMLAWYKWLEEERLVA
jgi:hypothetical protein